MRQAILDPVGMTDSGFYSAYEVRSGHAVGQEYWQVPIGPIGPLFFITGPVPLAMSFLFASGLMYSTVDDLYRWAQTLEQHSLASPASLNAMFTPYAFVCAGAGCSSAVSYGYGWFLGTEGTGAATRQVMWHDGGLPGFRTYIGRYPKDGTAIIVLSNLGQLAITALVTGSIEPIVFAKA
jgi:CubicO group peptidase (beta-lactamase class C family)